MIDFVVEYWLEVIFAGALSILAAAYARIKNKIHEGDAVKLGVQALLRDRIIQSYNHYMNAGYCPIYARENIDALWCQYKSLGGNGTVDHLMQEMKTLPTPNGEVEG